MRYEDPENKEFLEAIKQGCDFPFMCISLQKDE